MSEIYLIVPRLLPYWLLAGLAAMAMGVWLAVYWRGGRCFCISHYDALVIASMLFLWVGFDLVLLLFEPYSPRSVALSRLARAYTFAVLFYVGWRQVRRGGK